jgi:tetratricopeptide (TPR) repeat protein
MRHLALRLVLLLASLCLSSSTVWTQQQKERPVARTVIHGQVRDAVTHQGLQRALVTIEAQESGYAGQAETDSSGNFAIQGLSPGMYLVKTKMPGYEEMTQRVDLTLAFGSYLNLELRPRHAEQPAALPPEGPTARLAVRLAVVPEKARKEFAIAETLWKEGKDPNRCVDHLHKAIRAWPQFPDAYTLLASAYMQQGKQAEAKSAVDRAIALDPQLPEARFTLGSLENSRKDYASAEKSLMEGLKLDQESPQGHYELAKTYWAMGRWQEAEPHAFKAAALEPTMAPVHVVLGNIALRRQDADGALKEFQEYLRLDPQGPMADAVRAMVKKIQAAPVKR